MLYLHIFSLVQRLAVPSRVMPVKREDMSSWAARGRLPRPSPLKL